MIVVITILHLWWLAPLESNQVTPSQSNKLTKTAVIGQERMSDYVVLPLSQMIDDDFKNYKEGTLEPEDYSLIDSKLAEFVNEYNKSEIDRIKALAIKYPLLRHQNSKYNQSIHLKIYRRQYICAINKHGDKMVWVNCFCGKEDNWKKQVVFVFDGGSCFFNLKINLTKKIKYDEIVNGVA